VIVVVGGVEPSNVRAGLQLESDAARPEPIGEMEIVTRCELCGRGDLGLGPSGKPRRFADVGRNEHIRHRLLIEGAERGSYLRLPIGGESVDHAPHAP
jgi:hypothetical protein